MKEISGFNYHFIPPPKQALVFTCLRYNSFENTVGKGEIALNEQISPFPTVFSTLLERTFCHFLHIENNIIVICKPIHFGKSLNPSPCYPEILQP